MCCMGGGYGLRESPRSVLGGPAKAEEKKTSMKYRIVQPQVFMEVGENNVKNIKVTFSNSISEHYIESERKGGRKSVGPLQAKYGRRY